MKKLLVVLGVVALAACAPTEGVKQPTYTGESYDIKIHHGDGELRPNYEVYFGKKCEIDKNGRSWMSYLWLKSADANGNFQPLTASKSNCPPF